jgi:hypothetical protein
MWTILGTVIGFTVFALYAGLFEYVFHRWVLHRPSCALAFPYRMHTAVHHHVFGAGKTYQVQRPEDHGLILFEWWQPVLLLAGHAPLVWGLQVATGLLVFGGAMAALAGYYGLYEYGHWCMHNPGGRLIERTRVFRFLDAHHRLHHEVWGGGTSMWCCLSVISSSRPFGRRDQRIAPHDRIRRNANGR